MSNQNSCQAEKFLKRREKKILLNLKSMRTSTASELVIIELKMHIEGEECCFLMLSKSGEHIGKVLHVP
jgi:hypothetical protein